MKANGGPVDGRYRVRRALALALALCTACGSSSGGGADVPPAEAVVGPAGGSVSSGGVTIVVPAGALAADVTLRVAAATEEATIDAVTRVGPTVEIGPSGTTFATPAAVTLPFDAGDVPDGAAPADVRLYVADAAGGPFEALPSMVDEAAGTVTAEVSHLSVFAPGVRTPAAPLCPDPQDCDCEAVFATRPLDVVGAADLGRGVKTLCHDDATGQVTVLSNTWKEDSSGFLLPDQYFLTVLDASGLSRVTEEPTEEAEIAPAGSTCTGVWREPSHLLGGDVERGITWSAEVVERHESGASEPDWYEEVLTIDGPGGTLRYSLNRHLNQAAPYTDTNSLLREWILDARNGLVGRIAPDGSARFYLQAWHELHIDLIYVGDLAGEIARSAETADEDGFHTPAARKRLEIREGATSSGYSFESLFLSAAPDDEQADVLVVFAVAAPPVRGYRVSGGGALTVTPLPDLGLDELYGQFGWQNAGRGPGGLLYIQAQAAQFDASVLHTLDLRAFSLVHTWELGCVGAPTTSGFQLVPGADGQVLRFAQPPLNPEDRRTARVEFIRDGVLQAIGEAPVDNVPAMWLLVERPSPRLYVVDEMSGHVTAIRVP